MGFFANRKAGIYYNRAVAHLLQEDADAAMEELKRVISLRPDHAQAHYNLGLIYQHLGKNEEAIKCYEQATRIMPDYALPYNNIGAMKIESELYEEAIEALKRAVSLKSDFSEALYNLASAYEYVADSTHAAEVCRQLLRIEPEHPYAHKLMSIIEDSQTEVVRG